LTSGGSLKNIFKNNNDEEKDEDLINVDDSEDPTLNENDNPQLFFFFKHAQKQYVKKKD